MHELAVTENILDIALKHAKGKPITDLYLVIGQLSSIIDDSVQFYWTRSAREQLPRVRIYISAEYLPSYSAGIAKTGMRQRKMIMPVRTVEASMYWS